MEPIEDLQHDCLDYLHRTNDVENAKYHSLLNLTLPTSQTKQQFMKIAALSPSQHPSLNRTRNRRIPLATPVNHLKRLSTIATLSFVLQIGINSPSIVVLLKTDRILTYGLTTSSKNRNSTLSCLLISSSAAAPSTTTNWLTSFRNSLSSLLSK